MDTDGGRDGLNYLDDSRLWSVCKQQIDQLVEIIAPGQQGPTNAQSNDGFRVCSHNLRLVLNEYERTQDPAFIQPIRDFSEAVVKHLNAREVRP
jgi:hypothetical protein